MTHAQNPSNTPSNAITADADAEAYKQVQHYGRALIKVRTELADMWLEDSEAGRALIEEPFTGSFSWGAFLIEDCLKDEDRELAKKLLWLVEYDVSLICEWKAELMYYI